jgi:hypothetical protein
MKMRFIFTLLFSLFFIGIIWGQVPKTISYQGVLTDSDGAIVPDGNFNVRFRLYDAVTGGLPLWQEVQTVSTYNGIFNVILGNVVALNLPFNEPYWLGITIGTSAELVPRTPLTSSPYSLNAKGTFMERVEGPQLMISTEELTEILHFSIDHPGLFDVFLDAHLVAEIDVDGTGRYEFTIRRNSFDGIRVGTGWWRPGSSDYFQAVTISFSAVDKNVNGPADYFLVGRKFDSISKDVIISFSGVSVIWTAK